jgi:hypothetical protein
MSNNQYFKTRNASKPRKVKSVLFWNINIKGSARELLKKRSMEPIIERMNPRDKAGICHL